MKAKLPIFCSFFLVFIALSCSSLDIQQNEYDHMEEKLKTEGINIPPNESGGGFGKGFSIGDMLGSSSGTFDSVDEITFNVALDKLGFMPLASVDASSGVIITDWFNLYDTNIRIKINVRIVDSELNDNSIIVQLFKQRYDGSKWNDLGSDVEQSEKVKNNILDEARKLRNASDLN